jgi:Sulfotransferase domain
MSLSLSDLVSAGRRAVHATISPPVAWRPLRAPDETDLFLVAFPHSGLGWMARLYANASVILAGDPRKITPFNLGDLVPDIDRLRRAGPSPLPVPGFRCFRSHARRSRRYRKVVYLVRDPRRVMADRHAHLVEQGRWRGSLEEMVRHGSHGIRAWAAHAGGWLDQGETAAFALVRHEDLSARPAFELTRLYDLLGWHLDPAQAAEAVTRAGQAEGERAGPRLHGAPVPLSAMRLIGEAAGPLMRRLGYLAEAGPSPAAEAGVPIVKLFEDGP